MALVATKVLMIVKKTTGGLVWKKWPMNHTRRANVKKRCQRISQVEAVLKACAGEPPASASSQDLIVPKDAKTS